MTSAPPPDDASTPPGDNAPEHEPGAVAPGIIRDQSGAQALVGYVVDIGQDDGKARAWLDLSEHHMNRVGMLHGGLTAALLDAACGFTASRMFGGQGAVKTPLVTVSLTVNFVDGGRLGERVTATGHPAGGGRKIAHVTGELRGGDDRLLATCTGVFRRITT